MLKQIENEENLINLKESLEKFFEYDDKCDGMKMDCSKCKHKRLCEEICVLNTILRIRYSRNR